MGSMSTSVGSDRPVPGRRSGRAVFLALAAATLVSGCAGSSTPTDPATSSSVGEGASAATSGCADVVDVVITPEGSGMYRLDVTVPDTGWDKYADLWEVRGPDGAILAQRVLTHPHVEEQPFTRSRSGVGIPAGVKSVTVVARDSVAGFCGEPFQVGLP